MTATLSGGWKQRLAMSCSMLHEPTTVFLDEPTADVDPVARRQLWDILLDLAAAGITLFVTTHYMDEAERCNHVAYIYRSRLIANGTPDELEALDDVQPAGTRYIEITTREVTAALKTVKKLAGIHRATVFAQSVRALAAEDLDLDNLRCQLESQGLAIHDVRQVTPTLEDVFVALTQKYDQE
jgi:ABC-type multidrug transport system ATPase subunit